LREGVTAQAREKSKMKMLGLIFLRYADAIFLRYADAKFARVEAQTSGRWTRDLLLARLVSGEVSVEGLE